MLARGLGSGGGGGGSSVAHVSLVSFALLLLEKVECFQSVLLERDELSPRFLTADPLRERWQKAFKLQRRSRSRHLAGWCTVLRSYRNNEKGCSITGPTRGG